MSSLPVYQWKLAGQLYLWHYVPRVKGLLGWHLSADNKACESMVDLLDRMLAVAEKSEKRIPVGVPARMFVGAGNPWQPISEFLLQYPVGEVEDDYWHMKQAGEKTLALTIGRGKLIEFKKSLSELPQWKDDFALGPTVSGNRKSRKADQQRFDAECLWFWTKVE